MWEGNGPGNIYFAAVDMHPLVPDMLIGLFPINTGKWGEGNGDGESYIALSFSCDGVHWSQVTPLVWTVGQDGRTWGACGLAALACCPCLLPLPAALACCHCL